MGTQQILMIVLSVIVVGAAVAVGIQMFDNQSRNQARAAIQADLLQHGINIQACFRTPTMMGGTGGQPPANIGIVMSFINNGDPATTIQTPNGPYLFALSGTEGVDITMAEVPAVGGWTARARIAYDGRNTANFERGMWTYVGPAPGTAAPAFD